MARIAFIGLGNMGLPMVRNLLKAGHSVVGFDLAEANRTNAAAAGATLADSPAAAVAGVDAVVTALPAAPQVRAVYVEAGVFDAMPDGSIAVDCSTIDPETARAMSAAASAADVSYLDAPMSGGVGGAAAGTLTFMVGGSEDAFRRAHPLLQAMGKNIFYAGASGAGCAAKICNNMLLAISMIGVCEAFALAEKLGLDAHKLYDISSTATGRCWSLNDYCPAPGPVPTAPSNRDYAPGFSAALMLKDLRLAMAAAQEGGAATPLGAHAAQIYALMAASGGSDLDFSGVLKWLKGELGSP
ncbi:MAG: 3-hydroxyisobutyrate dehydrogenase [Pseudomonadota bacterium]